MPSPQPSASKQWDAVVVGDFFIDEVLSEFKSLPKLGEESFARQFRREIGGGAAITACGLARLGLNVAVLGLVGKEDGMWLIKRLIESGVDATAMDHHVDEPTGLTVSVSTREDRAYFTYYGANSGLHDLLGDPESRKLMAKARHVHFACAPDRTHEAGLFAALHKKRCRISIDVGWHPSWLTDPRNSEMLSQSDLFLPNEREAELMTNETEPHKMLRALRDRGLRGVGLKLGGKGAALLWDKTELICDPHPVSNLDTTGAGDCFDAGFIYAWLKGDPPQRCLEIANICGALSTRALGGIASFPTLKELRAALEAVKA
ncbi:MAG: carbohydrate kinase family protein [Bryobacteraceae bacterium]